MKYFCGAVLIFSGLFLFAQISGADGFSKAQCKVSGKIVEVVAIDIDGDGSKELVVSYKKGDGEKGKPRLAVFFGENGAYSLSPNIDIPLPSDTCVFDLGDLDGDKKINLILFRKWRIVSATLAKAGVGEFKTLIKRGSGIMFPNPEGEVPYADMVKDWGGEGTDALALPEYGKLNFFLLGDDGKLIEANTLAIKVKGGISTMGAAENGRNDYMIQSGITIPSIFLSPKEKSPRSLYTAFRQDVWFYKGFAENGKLFVFPILTAAEERDGNMDVVTRVMDLDGDGFSDVIVNKSGGSLRAFKSEVKIYRGNANGFESSPCFETEIKGFTPSIRFWDIDGDGRLEMALPQVDVGLTQMARMLLSQSVKMQFRIFRNRGTVGAMYHQEPDILRKMTFKIETEPVFHFIGLTPDFGGDFDGDGLPDLIMAYENGFGIWKNNGELKFSANPNFTMALPSIDVHRIDDLNGDGKSDIYLWESVNPKTRGQVTVYINRN